MIILFILSFFLLKTNEGKQLTEVDFFSKLVENYFSVLPFHTVGIECLNGFNTTRCVYIIDFYRLIQGRPLLLRILSETPKLINGIVSMSILKIPKKYETKMLNTSKWNIETTILDRSIPNGFLIEELFHSGLIELSNKINLNFLVIGVASGALQTFLTNKFPNINVTGIDIDPISLQVSYKWFNYKKTTKNQIKIIDAVKYIDEMFKNDEKVDVILIDACNHTFVENSWLCPASQLLDIRFIQKISKVITKKGIVVLNLLYNSTIKKRRKQFYETVRQKFGTYFHRCDFIDRNADNSALRCFNSNQKLNPSRFEIDRFLLSIGVVDINLSDN